MAETTKRERDRFLSAGRGFAIACVVWVHWGGAAISVSGLSIVGLDKAYQGVNWIQWASWVFVWAIPLYFAMFGTLSARAARGRPGTYYRRRYTRLLIPYYVYAAVMVAVELVLWATNTGTCGPHQATNPALFHFNPLLAFSWLMPYPHFDCLGLGQAAFWFLSVFLVLTLMMPLLVRIYDRPRLRYPMLVAFGVLALTGDAAVKGLGAVIGAPDRLSTPLPLMIWQMAVVWGAFAYLGIFYAGKVHEQPRVRRMLLPLGIGLGVLTILMVTAGPWPLALLSDSSGNQFPPTAAYLFGGAASLLLIVRARGFLVRLSEMPVVRPTIDWLDAKNYTIYVWHMVPITIVLYAARALGLLDVVGPAKSQGFALHGVPLPVDRLFWWIAPLPILFVLVKIFFPVENWTFPPRAWIARRKLRAQKAGAPAAVIDVAATDASSVSSASRA